MLASLAALAGNLQQNKQYDFLQNGLNLQNFNQCAVAVQKCPMIGSVREASCVDKAAKDNQVCSQSNQLADVLGISISQLQVKQQGNLTMVTAVYPADGQMHYYIAMPNGRLVDTVVDPRTLDTKLASKYSSSSFYTVNRSEPTIKTHDDGTQSVSAKLRVTEGCVACTVIGTAKVKFEFSQAGDLLKTKLDDFSDHA